MGTRQPDFRSCAVALKPSRTGICISIRTTWYWEPAVASCEIASIAFCPLSTMRTAAPAFVRKNLMSRWLSTPSSATRTRTPSSAPEVDPACSSASLNRESLGSSRIAQGPIVPCASGSGSIPTSSVNTLPLPWHDVTLKDPPSMCASADEILRPKPVPPYSRVIEWSACVNASKICPISSSVIPIPESVTLRLRRCSPSSYETSMRTSPSDVNLIAFEMRLNMIWRRRTGSHITRDGIAVQRLTWKPSPFSVARTRYRDAASSTILHRDIETHSTLSLPASIFDRSRISLMIASRCSLFRRMVIR